MANDFSRSRFFLQKLSFFCVLSLGLLSCGRASNQKFTNPNTDAKAKTGCIQGVIVNGLTATRIQGSVFGTSATNQINVVARNQILTAQAGPVASDATAPMNADYAVCGIPLDEPYPIHVAIDGYQTVEGYVEVASTDSWVSSQGDVTKAFPLKVVNVELFPKGSGSKDYTVTVAYDGAAIENATVYLKATGANILQNVTTNYLQPVNQRTEALKATTNSSGVATFAKADITLGAQYEIKIVPPATNSEAGVRTATIYVGYLSSAATTAITPYSAAYALPTGLPALTAVTDSSTDNSYDTDGKLVVTYNREIEIVPGTLDGATATLGNSLTAAIAAAVATNNASEQVDITVSGRTLTLKPKFLTAPNSAKEFGLTVTYGGVQIRPKSGPGSDTATTVSGTVKFYGGTNLP